MAMQPFSPRRIEFHGVRRNGDWRLKTYSVRYGPGSLEWDAFGPGLAMAIGALPLPAAAEGRIGVGFLIAHQGRTGNYAVLGWWDRENELNRPTCSPPGGCASVRLRPATYYALLENALAVATKGLTSPLALETE